MKKLILLILFILAVVNKELSLCHCPQLGVTDTLVSRNYFGRQVNSFEADLPVTACSLLDDPASHQEYFRAVFIRAPATLHVTAPSVEVLAALRLAPEQHPVIVAFRQGNVLSTAFHPELTDDLRWHRYFLNRCQNGG